jgi:hypothetical protein
LRTGAGGEFNKAINMEQYKTRVESGQETNNPYCLNEGSDRYRGGKRGSRRDTALLYEASKSSLVFVVESVLEMQYLT